LNPYQCADERQLQLLEALLVESVTSLTRPQPI